MSSHTSSSSLILLLFSLKNSFLNSPLKGPTFHPRFLTFSRGHSHPGVASAQDTIHLHPDTLRLLCPWPDWVQGGQISHVKCGKGGR